MRRRAALLASLSCLLTIPAGRAHTPFQQWVVYRRKHLLIGTNKVDAGSYELGKNLVARLAAQLPESKPRTARAPNAARLASLLTTEQLLLALLQPQDAIKLRRGEPPFTGYGPFDLRLLGAAGDFYLVCSPTLPDHHAWLISKALSAVLVVSNEASILPYHTGAQHYFSGRDMPSVPDIEAGAAIPHHH